MIVDKIPYRRALGRVHARAKVSCIQEVGLKYFPDKLWTKNYLSHVTLRDMAI